MHYIQALSIDQGFQKAKNHLELLNKYLDETNQPTLDIKSEL